MAKLFNGWLGYGSSIQSGLLQEPSDAQYARRSFILGDVDNGIVSDVAGGTVGPATVGWTTVSFAAVFDAQTGGNMLLWYPLSVPVVILSGCTITNAPGASRFIFPDLHTGRRSTLVWPSGSIIGQTVDGRPLTAGVSLQVSSGRLAAQSPSFGITVTMAALPTAQSTSGSGQLWNNGGVISVS